MRAMMDHEIGEAAGRIWQVLDSNNGKIAVSKLKTATKLQPNMMYLALGWLAREDKVSIERKGKGVQVLFK